MIRLATAAFIGATLGVPSSASADGITISPVVIEVAQPRQVVSITVTNHTDRPITLQSDTQLWRQENGVDRYDSSDDLMVVPAIAKVPANGSQVFRVALRRPKPEAVERTYRLILEDIGDEQTGSPGVAFKFTHNLPVMVAPSVKVFEAMRWEFCDPATPQAAAAPLACVRLLNQGNRRTKVRDLQLAGDGWTLDVPLPAPQNVLAGAAREWHVPLSPAQAHSVRALEVRTAQGELLHAQGSILGAQR